MSDATIKPVSIIGEPSVPGEMEVVGNTPFTVYSTDFMISPLQADADIYINSIHAGVDDPKKLDTIKAGDYTKITGNVPNTEMYVDTTETFYIKY